MGVNITVGKNVIKAKIGLVFKKSGLQPFFLITIVRFNDHSYNHPVSI